MRESNDKGITWWWDYLMSGKNWLPRKPDNLLLTWCINQQFAWNNIKTGLDDDDNKVSSGDVIPDDIGGLMNNSDCWNLIEKTQNYYITYGS